MKYAHAQALADILKALAHPTRVLMLEALGKGDCCVNDLSHLAASDLSTISRHLNRLKQAGIVTERRAGKMIIHHLACPCMLEALHCTCGVLDSTRRRRSSAGAASVR